MANMLEKEKSGGSLQTEGGMNAARRSEGDSVFTRLRHGAEEFSSMQQVVCSCVLEHYERVAFMTVEELAALCGASPATVVRTVKALGYESYHAMQAEFERLLMSTRVSLWWEMERSWDGEDSFSLPWVANDNVEAIRDSLTPQIIDGFKRASDMLARARRILVVGTRSSSAAAVFFQSILNQFFSNVLVATDGETVYDDLVDLGENDLLCAISLGGPHYSKATVSALAYASRNRVPSVLVTSSPSAPAVEYASVTLCVASTRKHYSLVPCLTVLEALVVSLGQKHRSAAQKKLRKLEDVLVRESITY